MGLVSTTATLTWGGGNKQIYENLGYKYTYIGDTFEVPIEQLTKSSGAIVDVECDFCGDIYKKTYKNYNNLRGSQYCCPKCLKHKKKTRDKNGNLQFIEIPYRNRDWLFEEYITKDRMAKDIAKECGINLRTLREWIAMLNIPDKHEYKTKDITKDVLIELYQNKHMTTVEIGELYNVSENTIANLLRRYDIPIPTRAELLEIYYDQKGGREIAREKFGTMGNRIKISCRQRDMRLEDFDGFKRDEDYRFRSSSEYKEWQKKVFERDNYICQKCGVRGGNLNAHHMYNFSEYPEKRTDIDNGVTFCEKCHLIKYPESFHSIYGQHNNTPEQVYEFIGRR